MFVRLKPNYFVLLACAVLMFAARAVLAERLPIKPYTVADGLVHNEISKIVRDSRGFLWFCTREGLSRFDGYEFVNLGTNHGLPHRVVNDFLETRSGELWVATNGGLVRFDPKGTDQVVQPKGFKAPMFTLIVPPDTDRLARVVTVLFEGRDGTIWCGTMRGLYRLEQSTGTTQLLPVHVGPRTGQREFIQVNDLLEDTRETLWIAATSGLYRRWTNGITASYTQSDGLPDDHIHDLLEDYRGQLWVATRANGFFQLKADETQSMPTIARAFSERDGLKTVWVSQLFESSDHRFWVATNRGIAEFFPESQEQPKFKTYGQSNGLLHYGITTLNEDSSGNLWLGSDAGAMKVARDGFISFGELDGLLSVFAVFGDREGRPCFRAAIFGDERRTVFEGANWDLRHPLQNYYARYGSFDGRSFTWLKPEVIANTQLGWVGEMLTLQARNGEWWLGTGVGIYRFPPTKYFSELKHSEPLNVYTVKDGLPGTQVFRLFEDSRGNIWTSTIDIPGIARWDRATGKWHDLTNEPDLPSPKNDVARSFAQDSKGNVWIGFSSGLARYNNERFRFFDADDGLPPGAIQNIYLDGAGRLWLASAGSGLIRIDGPAADKPEFKAYTTEQGLSSNVGEGITEDLFGHIYIGTGRGLDRVDPATGRIKHFTTADGLAPGRVISAFRANDGTLWFGTDQGLSRFVPITHAAHIAPPPILITQLLVGGEQQLTSMRGEINRALPDVRPDRNQLQIHFVALSFASGEALRYQYKLEGADRDWSGPAEQRSVNYARLSPGRYRFVVRAVNSEGVISSLPASVTFTILPPFWQRGWFIFLVILIVSLLVYALYRYRIARLVELANVRTRIASDLHDDIGANLTKISILSEVARQQLGNGNGKTDTPLASIARISRESVTAMSDIVWAINPQRDSSRDLIRRMRLHAEETCLPNHIQLEFEAPEKLQLKLGIETRRNLYLVFKEAINNAARHSGCRRIRVAFLFNRSGLNLEIADNGSGFDASSESDGNGLVSMRRRAASLGGKLDIDSCVGGGTMVRLRLSFTQSQK